MTARRAGSPVVIALLLAACAGGPVGPPSPTPTPTPPPGGFGTVTGTVTVEPTAGAPRAAAVPALPLRQAAGRPIYAPDRLMVRFRPGVATAAASAAHRHAGGVVVKSSDRLGVHVVRLAPGVAAASAMAAYRTSGLVETVEQDAYAYASATPNDPEYARQWHYPQINLPAAWDRITGGVVMVAVLDTGIRSDHPDLAGAGLIAAGYDFVDGDGDPTDPGCPDDPAEPSHGTHIAGTIAARTNNGTGVAGVVWGGATGVRLLPVRVLDGCGSGFYSDIALGIVFAAERGAKIINMSFGGTEGSGVIDAAITLARSMGVTLVAAGGNERCAPVNYPARNPNVIAVAATTNTNARAAYSNCGPEIDVAAPGGTATAGVLSTTWSPAGGHTYASFQGTSMAAAHVAGVAALMFARGITGPAAIQATLEGTATDLGPSGRDNEYGAGLINAAAAVSGGAAASRLRAFAGTLDGGTITIQSAVAEVSAGGTFTITGAHVGTRSIFVWQDANGSRTVDAGDYFGQRDGVPIQPFVTTSGVSVTVQRYGGPPLTVDGI